MPINYQNGKIYKIVSYENPGIVYIGSTSRRLLCDRMKGHRTSYKQWLNGKREGYCSSYELLKFNDCKIEFICNHPCNSKDELCTIEGDYIRKYKADENYCCVNIHINGRTKKEYRKDNKEKISKYKKEYYEDNKEKISNYQKDYYDDNKEKILKNRKEYRKDNKEKISEYNKEYYKNNREKLSKQHKEYNKNNREVILKYSNKYREKNKDKISKKKKINYTCECGSNIRNDNKLRHLKTKKHQKYLSSLV